MDIGEVTIRTQRTLATVYGGERDCNNIMAEVRGLCWMLVPRIGTYAKKIVL